MESHKYKDLDTDKLKEYLLDLTPKDTDREFIVCQGCLTHGLVERSTLNLKLCDNKDCTSCQQFHNSFKKIVDGK